MVVGGGLHALPDNAPTIVAGTPISLRLSCEVGSDARFADALVTGVVTSPVRIGGRVAIAEGTRWWGRVARTGRNDSTRRVIEIAFDSIDTGSSRTVLPLRLTGVDNARETVDRDGAILGAPAVKTARSRTNWIFLSLGVFSPVTAAALLAEKQLSERQRARPIHYAAGTDLSAVFTRTVSLPAWSSHNEPPPVWDSATVERAVKRWPLRAAAQGGRVASDLINIAIIGDSATVVNAFVAAGWAVPAPMGLKADVMTFAKAAIGRGYDQQPVSPMILDGRTPSFAFQKVQDTFAKRDHVRLWQRAADETGMPNVYLAGATHDVGLVYLRDRKHLTHRVDPAIDDERDKIVNDLLTAGCVAALSRAPRILSGPITVNDGQDSVVTDGAIAIVQLAPRCTAPEKRR